MTIPDAGSITKEVSLIIDNALTKEQVDTKPQLYRERDYSVSVVNESIWSEDCLLRYWCINGVICKLYESAAGLILSELVNSKLVKCFSANIQIEDYDLEIGSKFTLIMLTSH